MPEDFRKTPGTIAGTVVFGMLLAGLAVLYAFVVVSGIQAALDPDSDEAQGIEDGAQNITSEALWAESASNLVLLGLIPMAWVAFTRVRPRLGTLRYFHLERTHEAGRDILKGLGLGIVLWLAVVVIAILRLAVTGDLDTAFSENETAQSPLVEAFDRVLTLPLALFVAFVAGTAEEIFFRGVLQRWIGVWGQAAVFGVTHAGYGTIDQIVFPFALGILFGFMVKRGASLYLLMAAHFMFDFVQFSLLLAT